MNEEKGARKDEVKSIAFNDHLKQTTLKQHVHPKHTRLTYRKRYGAAQLSTSAPG
jgi:hypothetical protein